MIERVIRHRAALTAIGCAAAMDVLGGIAYGLAEHVAAWQGLYWAVTTATTIGYGDVTPKTGAGQVVAVVVMLTVVPLFGATFSLFTTALVAHEVHDAKREIKKHVDQRLSAAKGDDIWPG